MVQVPAATPVINPVVAPMVATAVLLLLQVPPGVASASDAEEPAHTLKIPVIGAIEVPPVTVIALVTAQPVGST